jgi:hypothetical protein
MHEFHLAASLPDRAITSNQFTHAIAVDEIHTREIEQEFLMAVAGENVNQVSELRAAITQRESSNRIDHNDSINLSCGDLKAHGGFTIFVFRAKLYIRLILAFNNTVPSLRRFADAPSGAEARFKEMLDF